HHRSLVAVLKHNAVFGSIGGLKNGHAENRLASLEAQHVNDPARYAIISAVPSEQDVIRLAARLHRNEFVVIGAVPGFIGGNGVFAADKLGPVIDQPE